MGLIREFGQCQQVAGVEAVGRLPVAGGIFVPALEAHRVERAFVRGALPDAGVDEADAQSCDGRLVGLSCGGLCCGRRCHGLFPFLCFRLAPLPTS